MITVSAGDRRRQDSPLCDRHLPRHVRAVNHRLNGKPPRLYLRANAGNAPHRGGRSPRLAPRNVVQLRARAVPRCVRIGQEDTQNAEFAGTRGDHVVFRDTCPPCDSQNYSSTRGDARSMIRRYQDLIPGDVFPKEGLRLLVSS